MNKIAFLSGIISLILTFLQFIPLGIRFGTIGESSNWICGYFAINNPIMAPYDILSLKIISYGNIEVYIWGVIENGILIPWIQKSFISFVFLFVLSIGAISSSLIASFKPTIFGKRMSNLNTVLISFIISYILIGIPIYGYEIIGLQLGYFDIFFLLSFGFYLMVINLILSIFANIKHKIE